MEPISFEEELNLMSHMAATAYELKHGSAETYRRKESMLNRKIIWLLYSYLDGNAWHSILKTALYS